MKRALSGEFEAQGTRDGETPMTTPTLSVTRPKSGSSRQSGSGTRGQPITSASQRFQLAPVLVPATGLRHEAIQDALRILSTWAVRAALGSAGTPHSDLTVPPPEAMNAPRTHQTEKTPCQ